MFVPQIPLQLSVPESIDTTIGNVITYIPTLLAALAVLLVGYVLGRIVGAVVTRVLNRIGIHRFATDTALEQLGDREGIASAIGTLVAYYVYFVAIVAAANVLDLPQLTELLADLGAWIPVLFGALFLLVVGFVVARVLGDIVTDLVDGFQIASVLESTPLSSVAKDYGFPRLVGKVVTYYVYLLTLLAVADVLDIAALSTLLNGFAAYLPLLLAGFLLLIVGIWLAERVADLVADTGTGRPTHLAAVGVKVLIYYLTITIALSTIGIDSSILTGLFGAFVVAFFGMLALALALGIGIAVGLGGQNYVAENVGSWVDAVGDALETPEK